MTDPQQTPLSSEELALESQLRSMAPVDLLRKAQADIANRLDRAPAGHRQLRWAAAIAACVLVAMALLILQHGQNHQPVARSIQAGNASTLPVDFANDDKQFAIATYSNTLAQSPASLNAILEQQSRRAQHEDVNESQIPHLGDVSIAAH